MIESLSVILWGRKVGVLIANREGHRSRACFCFNSDYVRDGYDIAPLRAPVKGVAAQRGLPVYPDEERLLGGLPSFIADPLPDHWGNIIFNGWAKVHHIRMRDLSALDHLAYIGRRDMEALEFVPPIAEELETPFRIKTVDLYQLARQAFGEAGRFNIPVPGSLIVESLFKVDMFAGGRRPKAVINVNLEKEQRYSGQMATPYPGYTLMIVRFDKHQKMSTTRIEYSYYLMAMDAGLQMMLSRLLEGEQTAHFLTERFDHRDDKKVHIQTLATIDPSADPYEALFEVACRIGVPPGKFRQLFRSIVLNVLGGNVDDHNKNFNFLMGNDGGWHVAPAHDCTFSIDPGAPCYVNRHSMTVNNRTEDITTEDLMEVARRYGIKAAEPFIGKAIDIVSRYPEYGQEADVGGEWIETVEKEITARMECVSNNRTGRLK